MTSATFAATVNHSYQLCSLKPPYITLYNLIIFITYKCIFYANYCHLSIAEQM